MRLVQKHPLDCHSALNFSVTSSLSLYWAPKKFTLQGCHEPETDIHQVLDENKTALGKDRCPELLTMMCHYLQLKRSLGGEDEMRGLGPWFHSQLAV